MALPAWFDRRYGPAIESEGHRRGGWPDGMRGIQVAGKASGSCGIAQDGAHRDRVASHRMARIDVDGSDRDDGR